MLNFFVDRISRLFEFTSSVSEDMGNLYWDVLELFDVVDVELPNMEGIELYIEDLPCFNFTIWSIPHLMYIKNFRGSFGEGLFPMCSITYYDFDVGASFLLVQLIPMLERLNKSSKLLTELTEFDYKRIMELIKAAESSSRLRSLMRLVEIIPFKRLTPFTRDFEKLFGSPESYHLSGEDLDYITDGIYSRVSHAKCFPYYKYIDLVPPHEKKLHTKGSTYMYIHIDPRRIEVYYLDYPSLSIKEVRELSVDNLLKLLDYGVCTIAYAFILLNKLRERMSRWKKGV